MVAVAVTETYVTCLLHLLPMYDKFTMVKSCGMSCFQVINNLNLKVDGHGELLVVKENNNLN